MLGDLLKLRDDGVYSKRSLGLKVRRSYKTLSICKCPIFINKSLDTSLYISCVYYYNHVFITGSLVASLMYLNSNLIRGYGIITQIQEMNVDLIAQNKNMKLIHTCLIPKRSSVQELSDEQIQSLVTF